MQIGLGIAPGATAEHDPIAQARAAEAAGFDFVSANDHVHATEPRYELWTLLTWIAACTSRIRVASRVLGVPFRNPGLTAKMAESLDRLSAGRLILGLGAGASEAELTAVGLPVAPVGERLTGLGEAITIMRGLWSQAPFSFDGRIHRAERAELAPPADRPIPIWLGTHGPRGLQLTGQLADGWIPSIDLAPPDRVEGMIGLIRSAAEAAGRDSGRITLVYNVTVSVGSVERDDPYRLSGSPEAIAQRLIGFAKLGFNAFNLIPLGPDQNAQIARLGSDVLPSVRAAAT